MTLSRTSDRAYSLLQQPCRASPSFLHETRKREWKRIISLQKKKMKQLEKLAGFGRYSNLGNPLNPYDVPVPPKEGKERLLQRLHTIAKSSIGVIGERSLQNPSVCRDLNTYQWIALCRLLHYKMHLTLTTPPTYILGCYELYS